MLKKIFQLIERLDEDAPDLTPREFLRYPIFKSFLRQFFPDSRHIQTLLDLHVSLANRVRLDFSMMEYSVQEEDEPGLEGDVDGVHMTLNRNGQ